MQKQREHSKVRWLLAKGILMLLILALVVGSFGACCRNSPEEYEEHKRVQHHALVGTWQWDEITSYEYTFRADGTGARGIAPDLDEFTWNSPEAGNVIMQSDTLDENWSYTIISDMLTLNSRQVPGMSFSYRRAE